MERYAIYDRNTRHNTIKQLCTFSTEAQAQAKLKEFFLYDLEKYDGTNELLNQLDGIKLANGEIIDYQTFSTMEAVEDYEYIFTGRRYDFDTHIYYIDYAEKVIYQAYVDDNLVYESEDYEPAVSDLPCFDAIARKLRTYPPQMYMIEVRIDRNGKTIYNNYADYDYEKSEWVEE